MFKKLTSLHAKQDFTLAIITGNLFSDDDEALSELLDGNINVPVSTYYTVGDKPLPQRVIDRLEKDEDVCENLHYIGKRSTTKTAEGIRIVALGGILDENIIGGASNEKYLPFHTVTDAKMLKGANSADILLTTSWPSNIGNGSKVPMPDASADIPMYDHISELCQVLKPRYHFTSSPSFFYEREPYFHSPTEDAPTSRPLTRFISMAATGNPAKQKSLYAFSLQKTVDFSAPLPHGTTVSPFSTTNNPRKRAALDPAPYSRFAHDNNGDHKRFRRNRGPPPGPDTCFFCLSNPDIGTHLIASIGDDAYMTLAKGPLVEASTNAHLGIDFPAHALIIPLAHEPTLAMITDPEVRTRSYDEMIKYRNALQIMVSLRSVNKLGAVTYEISRTGIRHTHWQFVPMPVDLIRTGVVEAAFKVEAENYQYPPFEMKDIGVGVGAGDFFRVWIWTPSGDEDENNDGKMTSLLLPLDTDTRFDLQFGRRVLAKLLGLEKRIQWRDCEQSIEAETAEVDAFKAAFKEHDFTME